jgi:serine/threonine-protein kinase
MGTPSYMAPEQATGNNAVVGRVTDVYGLGAVLYQLLTGHPPFAGGTTYETIKLLLDNEPKSPRFWNRKIDRDLSTICLKCLEKDPARRYSSALALAEDLEHWWKHEPLAARRTGFVRRGAKWTRRNPSSAFLASALVALGAIVGWEVWRSEFVHAPVTTGIAVLPFENLSDQKESGAFVDGSQDDILTKLAKIADLKVISRTSVMEYRGKRNLRQIGNDLGVSHVLEGSIRRAGSHLHVNAQLIDTRTDTHVWAEQYDRDLNDLFALQSEIAQKVAGQLHAIIAPAERAAIERPPTNDLVAYDRYVEAVSLIRDSFYNTNQPRERGFSQAVKLLDQAVARDPNFLLAYCRLAEAHDTLHFIGADDTPRRLALAQSAIDTAFRVRPGSGVAHLALGRHFYLGYLDYDRARDELAIAARTLPNDPQIFELNGYIDRRQNRWHDAVRNLERAMELDPQNVNILNSAAVTYRMMRNYPPAKAIIDRLIALEPNQILHRRRRAELDFDERANFRPLWALYEQALAQQPSSEMHLWYTFIPAFFQRDVVGAEKALAGDGHGLNPRRLSDMMFSHDVLEGLVARMKGDAAAAQAAFTAARPEYEKSVHEEPDNGRELCILGLIDAGLGRKDEALREGRRALELAPLAKGAFDNTDVLYYYAVICGWTGESALAFEQLETLIKTPAGPSYGDLRLNPVWDPLRSDPRFDKIVASLAPKDILATH